MQRHERFFKFGKSVSPARADHGPHQFDRGTGEGEIRLGRNGRPFRVMLSRALVPFLVQSVNRPVPASSRSTARGPAVGMWI